MKPTQNIIHSSRMLYVEPDKKTNTWLSQNGLQLPVAITKYGVIDKITVVLKFVKTSLSKNDPATATNADALISTPKRTAVRVLTKIYHKKRWRAIKNPAHPTRWRIASLIVEPFRETFAYAISLSNEFCFRTSLSSRIIT